jgi:prepilin-type N-terminal cleavage/methylation domain-containing protein
MNHPILKPTRLSGNRRLPGFTLIEILTVIAIITILMAAGAIGIGNLNAGKGVTSAVATCESLFEEARTIAVSKRCKTRVMVDVDDVNSDNYLRRVVIAYENVTLNPDGTVASRNWVLSNRGYEMPKGTFFSKVHSKKKDRDTGTETEIDIEPMTMVNDTGTVVAAYTGDYAYYTFNGEGIFEDAGSSFVVGAGVRPKGQEPKTVRGASRDFAGFVVWRNGRTSVYRSPNQISEDIKDLAESNVEF